MRDQKLNGRQKRKDGKKRFFFKISRTQNAWTTLSKMNLRISEYNGWTVPGAYLPDWWTPSCSKRRYLPLTSLQAMTWTRNSSLPYVPEHSLAMMPAVKELSSIFENDILISEFLKMLWDISRTKTSEIQKKRRIPLLGTVSAHRFALRWQLNEKETRNGMKHGEKWRRRVFVKSDPKLPA